MAKMSPMPSSADVVFSVGGKVINDAQWPAVNGNQYSGGAAMDLPDDHILFFLVHFSVHGRDRGILGMHLVSEPISLPSGVDEGDSLGYGQGFAEVAQCVWLPLLFFHTEEELTDTLQG